MPAVLKNRLQLQVALQFLTLQIVVFSVVSLAHASDYPGAVPLTSIRPAASDLVYENQVLQPDQAQDLVRRRLVSDLSTLNPRSDTHIWRNEYPTARHEITDDLPLAALGEQFNYVALDEQPIGRAGILVSKISPSGSPVFYRLVLDLKGRSTIVRRDLLRRIGYLVPSTGLLRVATVNFSSAFAKSETIRDLNRSLADTANQFILNSGDESSLSLQLQDVLVYAGTADSVYNLARGDMAASLIQGRRLFNSLLVPFNLVDIPQSVNKFSWVPGRILNQSLLLPHSDAQEFNPSLEDAKWITQRILTLTRSDWQSVVQSAQYPAEVAELVVEKIIARRNFLRQTFGLPGRDIPVNSRISDGPLLANGKITQEIWPGYAPHFAGVDPENPLSSEELVALIESKSITNLISNAVSEFNIRFLPRTDIGRRLFDRQLDLAVDQFVQFITTGKVQEIPLGFYTVPYYNTNLILAREVVAGQYLGSDNMIQMADVVGVTLDGGWFFNGEGLPVNWGATAQAGVEVVRTYTHLKPFNSIRPVLNERFSNMIVPFLQHEQQNPLRRIVQLGRRLRNLPETASEADRAKINEEVQQKLAEFETTFGPRESFIIQTGLTPKLALQLGYGMSDNVSAFMRFKNGFTILQRLQIYRKDGNGKIFQIYNDPSFFNTFDIAMGLRAQIPILELGFTWTRGQIRSNFFELSLNPKLDENPDFFKNVESLLSVIDTSRTGALRADHSPWVIEHNFSETASRVNFLAWRSLNTRLRDDIQVTHPEGQKQSYVRRSLGKRTGRDLESLTLEIADAVIDEVNDSDFNVDLATTSTGNPGDTFHGRSVARQVTLETTHSAPANGEIPDLRNMLINVNYRWKGWSIDREDATQIISELNEKFDRTLFPEFPLAQTNRILFYSIDMNINLYRRALDHILSLSDDDVAAIFRSNRLPRHRGSIEVTINRFNHKRRWFGTYIRRGNTNEAYRMLLELVNMSEITLSFEGLKLLVGGEDSLFVAGSVQGFRQGDENATAQITSHSMGLIGSRHPNGPLATLQQSIGISSGELFGFWLLNRY